MIASACVNTLFAGEIVSGTVAMKVTINRPICNKSPCGQIGGKRRITVPSRIKGPIIKEIDSLVKHIPFIDVIGIGEAGSDRAQAQHNRERDQEKPENRILRSRPADFWRGIEGFHLCCERIHNKHRPAREIKDILFPQRPALLILNVNRSRIP